MGATFSRPLMFYTWWDDNVNQRSSNGSIETASLIVAVVAVVVTVLLWRIDKKRARAEQPRLELVTERRNSRASFADLEAESPEAVRALTVELAPRSLEYVAPSPGERTFTSDYLAVAALRNRGGSVAISPTVRITGPRDARLWVLGTSNWDSGLDQNGLPYRLYVDKGRQILPGMAERIEGIVAFSFPRRQGPYRFRVEIGCASGKWSDSFHVRVTAKQLTPAEIANARGVVAFQRKRMKLAERLFRAALASEREEPAIWFNHGTTLLHLGHHPRAYRQLSKARSLATEKGIIWAISPRLRYSSASMAKL